MKYLTLLFCFLLVFVGSTPSVSAGMPQASQEARYAGYTLSDIEELLGDENSVVRRRAALSLLPFCLNKVEGYQSVLLQALNHEDRAVVFWACDLAAKLEPPVAEVADRVAMLAKEPGQQKSRLAATYADYVLNKNFDSLEFLLQVIEAPLTGETFVDTKHMASVLTAADFIAKIGPERLGDKRAAVIQRLEDQSAKVVKRLKDGGVHGQVYHCQKACDRTALLLKKPLFESSAIPDPIVVDVAGRSAMPVKRMSNQPQVWPGVERPNILWISCEDISPNLGCYGDPDAVTPNLDRLASQGVLFRNAFTHAGVCAVLRSGVITGRYPISIGTQHMRSFRPTLTDSPCFPELLRAAGYFCTNRSKTDYQFKHSPQTWDREGGRHQDWRERPNPDQPFFSVVNFTISHESQVRHGLKKHQEILAKLSAGQKHDPEKVQLPPYYPDTPEVRKDMAWYHDNISEMDRQAGELLQRLEDDGLTDSTVVVFWSDHGQGIPRGKRWLYDSGTHVPMLVRFPDKFAAGSERQELVTLLDLAPTMLAMAGAEIPANMDGRVLWGPERQAEPQTLFFHRDRMDETYDLIRSARDHRFRYIRNYQPLRTYNQYLEYLELMPTMKVWREQHHAGELAPAAEQWFHTKPLEELYDVVADPYQVKNLAHDPRYAETLQQLRDATEAWQLEQGDTGMTPEVIMLDELWPDKN